MSKLEKARVAQRLADMYADDPERRKLYQRLVFDHASEKTMGRWMDLLKAPTVVQKAVEDEHLKLVQGARVGRQRQEIQDKIAEQIEAGGDPKKVVAEHVRLRGGRRMKTELDEARSRFWKCLDKDVKKLSDNLSEVKSSFRKDQRPLLQRVFKLSGGLMRHIKENPDECLTLQEQGEELAATLRERR